MEPLTILLDHCIEGEQEEGDSARLSLHLCIESVISKKSLGLHVDTMSGVCLHVKRPSGSGMQVSHLMADSMTSPYPTDSAHPCETPVGYFTYHSDCSHTCDLPARGYRTCYPSTLGPRPYENSNSTINARAFLQVVPHQLLSFVPPSSSLLSASLVARRRRHCRRRSQHP